MMIPINDKSSYPGPRDDGGFTLIEVLIVLLIIGLVSLMVKMCIRDRLRPGKYFCRGRIPSSVRERFAI